MTLQSFKVISPNNSHTQAYEIYTLHCICPYHNLCALLKLGNYLHFLVLKTNVQQQLIQIDPSTYIQTNSNIYVYNLNTVIHVPI